MLTYNLIPRNLSNFFASISSGFNEPVSNFFNNVAFSLICIPNCSCVRPFFILASLINFANSGLSIVSSVILILEPAPFGVGLLIILLLGAVDGTYGFPRLEHRLQTLNTVPSIKTALFTSIILRPHSSQNDDDIC